MKKILILSGLVVTTLVGIDAIGVEDPEILDIKSTKPYVREHKAEKGFPQFQQELTTGGQGGPATPALPEPVPEPELPDDLKLIGGEDN